MRPSLAARRATSVVSLALLAAACRDRGAEGEAVERTTVTVSAAASLREVMADVERELEAERPGVDVRVNLGASGALRQQIEQGAEVDVFLSAAEAPMDALQRAQLVDPRTRRVVAGNTLVLVAPVGSATVRRWEDLALPAVRRVALGAPASVPAGDYARQTLRALGLEAAVERRAVLGNSVRQVLAHVESGEADAGVVYATDARTSRGVRVVAPAPAGTHRPITYVLAVVSATRRRDEATAVAGYVAGPRGREAFRRHGFRVD
jgi:molybdate transport system substrate-binding protein